MKNLPFAHLGPIFHCRGEACVPVISVGKDLRQYLFQPHSLKKLMYELLFGMYPEIEPGPIRSGLTDILPGY
jgi:hypothetical protein